MHGVLEQIDRGCFCLFTKEYAKRCIWTSCTPPPGLSQRVPVLAGAAVCFFFFFGIVYSCTVWAGVTPAAREPLIVFSTLVCLSGNPDCISSVLRKRMWMPCPSVALCIAYMRRQVYPLLAGFSHEGSLPAQTREEPCRAVQ